MLYNYLDVNTSTLISSLNDKKEETEEYQDAFISFQNFYNILPNDGRLNYDTISLMKQIIIN